MYRNKSGFHGGREAGGCKASPLLELSSSVLSQSESSILGGPCSPLGRSWGGMGREPHNVTRPYWGRWLPFGSPR